MTRYSIRACREMQDWVNAAKRVVLFQSQGQEVPNGVENEQGNKCRVLEGNRERQVHSEQLQENWYEKNPSVLQRKSTPRPKVWLDYARVSAWRWRWCPIKREFPLFFSSFCVSINFDDVVIVMTTSSQRVLTILFVCRSKVKTN